MCTTQSEAGKMIEEIANKRHLKSNSYKKKETKENTQQPNVVNLHSYSAKKADDLALARILSRANKQTW
ncbi:hypothetical protein BZJ19_05790 [Salinivibrio proteolyticus]|nr:hypothetical protein BZJ19_05790 [Salinivibrio proteolyticus]